MPGDACTVAGFLARSVTMCRSNAGAVCSSSYSDLIASKLNSFPQVRSVLLVTVTGEWALPVLISTHKSYAIFFSPLSSWGGSDKAALVGTWFPAKVNPPQSQTLIFKYSHTLKFLSIHLTIDMCIRALTATVQAWHGSSSVAKYLDITSVGQIYIILKYMTTGQRKNNHNYCLF